MTPEYEAWCDGIMAHEKGITTNPHDGKDVILADQWHRGWLLADLMLPQQYAAMAVMNVQ